MVEHDFKVGDPVEYYRVRHGVETVKRGYITKIGPHRIIVKLESDDSVGVVPASIRHPKVGTV